MKSIILFSLITLYALFGNTKDLFVLGTYDIETAEHLTWARDSLFLNTIRSSWLDSQDYTEGYLTVAENLGLNIILGDAGVDGVSRLSRYYYIWRKLWESDSDYVFHSTGFKVFDQAASNHYAWKCIVDYHPAGLMQYGSSGWQAKIQTHHIRPIYIAQFRLKIDKESGNSTEKVCSLVVSVRRKKELVLRADTVLRVRNFPGANQYGLFRLNFTKDRLDFDNYEYHIWWYGCVNFWSDYVEVKDEHADMLVDGMYDDSLDIIFSSYQRFPALSYFYLKDEPFYGQFEASQYLMSYINKYYKRTPGIQALGAQGEKYFADYARAVKPSVLMFDKYPIRDYTPKSGPIFQKALDGLCEQLSDMRAVAHAETLDFWFIVQAFGRYESLHSDEGGFARKWRLPTPQELRCMTWLALVYGAKGIFYYCFESRIEDDLYLRGLLRFDNEPREHLYSTVRALNADLLTLGPLLVSLISKDVYSANEQLQESLIQDLDRSPTLQIGVFHNGRGKQYFIIVNRECEPTGLRVVKLKILLNDVILVNQVNGKRIYPTKITSSSAYFTIPLQPGSGECYFLQH